jgi:hypothetical protein
MEGHVDDDEVLPAFFMQEMKNQIMEESEKT